MNALITATAVLFAHAAPVADNPPEPSVALTVVAKTSKYKFDGGGRTPAEYKKHLEEIAKVHKDGKPTQPPKPPAVDIALKLTNTSKNEVTIYVGGESNVYTFELTGGDGPVALNSGLAFTEEFRAPRAVTLAPGKSYEIPVKRLADGHRGAERYVYWTGPGEYKLSAKYTLADASGQKGAELKSEPVKITVEK